MVSWGRSACTSLHFYFFFENKSRPSRRARRRESSGEGGRGSFLLDLTSAQREWASERERIMESLWFFSDESLPGDRGSKWEGRQEFFFPPLLDLFFSEKRWLLRLGHTRAHSWWCHSSRFHLRLQGILTFLEWQSTTCICSMLCLFRSTL